MYGDSMQKNSALGDDPSVFFFFSCEFLGKA